MTYIRTERVNDNSVYLLGLIPWKSASTVLLWFYFFNQLLHCIYRYGLHVLQDVEGLTISLYLQEEDQFPCENSGSMFTWFTCFDIGVMSRSKRVNILYAYALDQKKNSLHAKSQV